MSERQLIDLVDWSVPPPALNVVYAPIMSPKKGEQRHALIVCEEFLGVKTHWIEKRTTGCLGAEEGCEGCRAKKPSRWKGYMGVLNLAGGKLWLAEFTPRAYGDVAQALAGGGKGLRGWHLTLSRANTHAQAQVRAAIRPPTVQEKDIHLPAAFDIRRTLLLIWERLEVKKTLHKRRQDDDEQE